ncbi:BCCT family transporter [Azohydromonas caseinilytica]|uniref:Uncharacterized protein n=1 Tax=Azohydromonas caseinilytica TaxID=2728836 RepID=A0A848FHJ5_9BURK|nr:BCCT family transporter [Azohydromonas caseinilytica]NML17321.1 hypothetical protein [Azohydromonas caseinilytica]
MELSVSACLIVAVVLRSVLAPEGLAAVFDNALNVITRNFGWFHPWVVLALVGAAIALAGGRHGRLRLGGEDEKSEFSRGAWFSMLFAAGMGNGLVFWGVAKPIFHYGELPLPGVAARTIVAPWRGGRTNWTAHERHERALGRRLENLSVELPSRPPEKP